MGRAAELERLATAAAEGRGAVLHGPPGIGKTRLADETIAIATASRHVERVRATAAASSLPFGSFGSLPLIPIPPAAGRTGLIRELATLLADRAEGRPLMLAVDDAHLLDPGSAALVHHLVGGGAATLVATVRSGEPCPDAIVALWKDLGVERIDLGPLDPAETAGLTEALLGGPVDGATGRRLVEITDGNPLYLRELVRGAVEGGDLEPIGGVWRRRRQPRIGPRLAELLEERLDAIHANEREALEVLALSEPIAVDRFEDLVGGAAAALEGAGLLRIEPDETGPQARVAHPLYGELLRERMPRLAAARQMRRLAEEFSRDGVAGPDLIRVARWRLESGAPCRPEELVAASMQAAVAFDHPLAARLAKAAVEAGGGFAARQALGEALMGTGDVTGAEAELAMAAAEASADDERARNAVARADNLFWLLGDETGAVAVVAAAEEGVEAPPARASLGAARATILLFGGETAAATELAAAMAASADPALPFAWQAAFTAAWGLTCGGRPEAAVGLLDRYIGLARDGAPLPPGFSPLLLRINRCTALGFAGRLEEAAAEGTATYQEAIAAGAESLRAIAALALATVVRDQGEVAHAARLLRESVAELREVDLFRHLTAALGELAQTEALLGDAAAAEAALAEAEARRVPSFRMDEWGVGLGRAWVAMALGEQSAAASASRRAAETTGACGQLTLQARCLHDAMRLGDREAATELIGLCASVEGELAGAFAEHAAARLADDGAALLNAASRFSRIGADLFAADAVAAASRSLARSDRLDAARAAAARAGALRARCDSVVTPDLAGLATPELSARQREVALLAAHGASNREIAERLVVSIRTVENHLYAVYERLGVAGRRELPEVLGEVAEK
ncbi:MAG: LuxR C-terminal-related transcriptional regulator [Solirubrobacterales bacterium]